MFWEQCGLYFGVSTTVLLIAIRNICKGEPPKTHNSRIVFMFTALYVNITIMTKGALSQHAVVFLSAFSRYELADQVRWPRLPNRPITIRCALPAKRSGGLWLVDSSLEAYFSSHLDRIFSHIQGTLIWYLCGYATAWLWTGAAGKG